MVILDGESLSALFFLGILSGFGSFWLWVDIAGDWTFSTDGRQGLTMYTACVGNQPRQLGLALCATGPAHGYIVSQTLV